MRTNQRRVSIEQWQARSNFAWTYEDCREASALSSKCSETISAASRIRPEEASELELKRQEIFESNMPNLMGVSKAQVHKLFGQSRMSPRFNSSLEFNCKTGILSFTFDQNKVIKFDFRPYDIEQIITPPPPTIEAVN